ncbi:MAG: M15 family metallopeptidase [Clostridia bacterium]|nr:M15 family metallopeptidase [Clostridia bacterium]
MKKKHTTSIIIIVVLIVVLLCVGGFFVSTYLLSDPGTGNNDPAPTNASDVMTQASDPSATDATDASAEDSANVIKKEIKVEDRPLLIVNRMNKLPADYLPYLEETVEGSGIYLEAAAAKAFMRMYTDAFAMGVFLTPVDGYRSLERQQHLLDALIDSYIADGYDAADAALYAGKEKLPAGCSEHNAGLGVDIGVADASFKDTAEYAWLQEYAADYGFIERYTAEKELVTDVKAEPWHWRYVGSADMAYAIKDSGLSFEEWMTLHYNDWLAEKEAAAATEATEEVDDEEAEEYEEVYDEEVYDEEYIEGEEVVVDEEYEDYEEDAEAEDVGDAA